MIRQFKVQTLTMETKLQAHVSEAEPGLGVACSCGDSWAGRRSKAVGSNADRDHVTIERCSLQEAPTVLLDVWRDFNPTSKHSVVHTLTARTFCAEHGWHERGRTLALYPNIHWPQDPQPTCTNTEQVPFLG